MNRLRLYLLALTALLVCTVKADEGMWLLQLMQQQHSIDMMKKQGLKLEAQDLYNPNGVSVKDAVGIFGDGWFLGYFQRDGTSYSGIKVHLHRTYRRYNRYCEC